MSNDEQNNNDVIADEIRFAPGSKYASVADFRKDQFTQRYKTDLAFQQRCDEKLARSASSFANVRVVSNDGDHRMAGAVRHSNGDIEAGVISLDSPNGRKPEGSDGGEGGAAPQIEHLPGGVMRAHVSRSDLPLIPVDESRKAFEEEKAWREKQRLAKYHKIEPLPVKK